MSHITAACWIALASSHSFEESEPELSKDASCVSEAVGDDDNSSRISEAEPELPKDPSDMISSVCCWGLGVRAGVLRS